MGRLYPGLEREMLESPAWLLPFAAGNDNHGRSPAYKAFLFALPLSLSRSLSPSRRVSLTPPPLPSDPRPRRTPAPGIELRGREARPRAATFVPACLSRLAVPLVRAPCAPPRRTKEFSSFARRTRPGVPFGGAAGMPLKRPRGGRFSWNRQIREFYFVHVCSFDAPLSVQPDLASVFKLSLSPYQKNPKCALDNAAIVPRLARY